MTVAQVYEKEKKRGINVLTSLQENDGGVVVQNSHGHAGIVRETTGRIAGGDSVH